VRKVGSNEARVSWLASVVLVLTGCAQIIGANDYTTQTGSSSGSSCPSGSPGCFCGTPTTREEFLNACTTAQCVPFDASRVTGLKTDGSRPPLPAGMGGSTGATTSASTTAATTTATSTSTSVSGSSVSSSSSTGGNTNLCSDLPNPVYISGSSASKGFLSVIAQALAAQGEMTVIYQSQGSCNGVDEILNGTLATGTASHWDPTQPNVAQAERSCDLAPGGVTIDIGVSDVFAETCTPLPGGLPQTVADNFGPVQAMALVTPSGSSEKSISADAAYFVYGFGNMSGIAPWNDETSIFQRNGQSGTQNVIAKSIGVPADQFKGQQNSTSDAMLNALVTAGQSASTAQKAIGLLAADYADTNRSKLSVLAFEDLGQKCAFYPDSSPTSLDKANVRDGHYSLWGPLHFLTKNPASQTTAKLINYLTGVQPINGLNLVQIYVDAHVVPLCAMRVKRTADGGAPAPYAPTNPCGCAFEARATGSTTCKACMSAGECPSSAPNCSFGYCEH